MTTILILILLVAVIFYGMLEYYQVKLGTKPKRTPANVASALAQLLDSPPDDNDPQGGRILELGSAYGDLVLGLARRLPLWQVDGVEPNPAPWAISIVRTMGKSFSNYRFFFGDPDERSLRNYDVIFVHQDQKILTKWAPGIARRLPTGTLVVCLNTQFPRATPVNTIKIDQASTLYIYQKRAQVAPEVPVEQQLPPVPPAQAAV